MAAIPADAALEDQKQIRDAIVSRINDFNQRVRLEALLALGRVGIDPSAIHALLGAFPNLKDPWLQSAFLGVAASNYPQFIAGALDAGNADAYADLIAQLASQTGEKQDAAEAAQLVILIASKPASADRLKEVALDGLTRELKPEIVPAWTPELHEAFRSLLGSSNADLAAFSLPLAARWDKSGALADEVKSLVQQLAVKLADASQPDDPSRPTRHESPCRARPECGHRAVCRPHSRLRKFRILAAAHHHRARQYFRAQGGGVADGSLVRGCPANCRTPF